MPETPEPSWMSLAMDPVSLTIYVAGFGTSREQCVAHTERVDAAYSLVVQASDGWAKTIYDWLRKSGAVHDDAVQGVRGIGAAISEMLEEIEG